MYVWENKINEEMEESSISQFNNVLTGHKECKKNTGTN